MAHPDGAIGPERLPPIAEAAMTPEQRRVVDAIKAGPRGSLRGPFAALLRSPEVADRVQRLGEQMRFRSSLQPALNELAILLCGRAWSAQFEFYAHTLLAREAGLPESIITAIAERREPPDMDADQRAVWAFCEALQRTRFVPDAIYAETVARFGEQGVIDLIAVSGYYTIVSMVLNVARVPVPEGVALPLAPL